MSIQLVSDVSAAGKRSSDVEFVSSDTHEYTICLLGDWPIKTTETTSSNPKIAPVPVAVHEIATDFDSPIVQVDCGSGWCCLLCDDGGAYSFGDNTYGQLGQGHNRPFTTEPFPLSIPVCLQPRRRILRLSCGSSHGGFVLDRGELYTFGCGSYGRLGTGNEENTSIPTMIHVKWSTLVVSTPTNNRKPIHPVVATEEEDEVYFTDVSCGDRHTLALAGRTTGRSTKHTRTGVISFGDGMHGRLGLGDEKDRHEGALLTTWLAASTVLGSGIAGNNECISPPTITMICAGNTHNLALSASGDVFSWGNGVDGQLGHGTAVSEWVPRQLGFFKNLSVTSMRCGTSHSVAISRTGVVYTWGQGAEGQLGLDLEDEAINVVDKSVWIPHVVGILKGSAHRVNIRTIAARQNMSLAVDARDRLFVWGDNAHEQLGLPLSVNTTIGTKSYVSKPKLVSYMDLHAPKTALSGSPASRVSSLREIVAASKPNPIRLGLTHLNAGDRFIMLIFKTKPGISSCTLGASREIAAFEGSLEKKEVTGSDTKWNFSLTDDLSIAAFPSRKPAYYQFMVNYKVFIQPTIRSRDDEDSEDEMEKEVQKRSHRRRCSTFRQRGGLISTTNPDIGVSSEEDLCDDTTASVVPVQGFNSWLDKRLNSPSTSYLAGHAFANSPRFSSKEIETKSTISTKESTISRPTSLPVRPKSGFGRTLSTRRCTVIMQENLQKKSTSCSNSPTKQSNKDLSPKQSPAKNSSLVIVPFGSSVDSRFGPAPQIKPVTTPIYPEKCSIRGRGS